MCKKLPAPKRNRPASAATRDRRALAAAKQEPLPAHEQRRRAEANRECDSRWYPTAPKLDPLAHVRGNPRYKGEPVAPLPRGRQLTLADLVYAFDVTGEIRTKYAARAAAKLAA